MVDRETDRRSILKLSGVAAIASLSGCASFARQANTGGETTTASQSGGQTTTARPETQTAEGNETDADSSDEMSPLTVSDPSFDLPTESLPSLQTDNRYPTVGTADTTVTVYGNWKCPYTQEFVQQQFGTLIEDYVATGDLSVEFRNVAYMDGEPYLGPDAPRASEAGLAVWNIDPESFWTYFAYVFANQPQERYDWATTDNLVRIAEEADVNGIDQIQRAIRSRAYAQSVQLSADSAAELDITTVPRVVSDDEVTAPTVDFEATREQLERAAGGSTFGETTTESDDSFGGNSTENDTSFGESTTESDTAFGSSSGGNESGTANNSSTTFGSDETTESDSDDAF
ncbi:MULTISPECIES: DsbA family protein [Haloferax]|uniref:Disulfide bond formation protein D n=1 Tax=Haloferax massiliensis TaxID=1476858 RepID=A0A0D6JWD8_9EURY|nr:MULTISPECIES: thioredoxin domain-containing protein [Haloferax]MDS0242195.1 DsbA family protein [Haloferax sp. S2CR25]MDS0445316.1 DsbA family protein [Haloferax sp. S2CR25-2]CQR52932.1 Disulfide bond formation protein D precursor [Haloferax massiliensis]